jgi:hypothetical protein
VVEPGTEIALGFDGSLNDDATVLIGCRMSDGFLFPVGIWAKPRAGGQLVGGPPLTCSRRSVRRSPGTR